MTVVAQKACSRCGHPMSSVAEIAPFAGGPGLVAFICTDSAPPTASYSTLEARLGDRMGPQCVALKASHNRDCDGSTPPASRYCRQGIECASDARCALSVNCFTQGFAGT